MLAERFAPLLTLPIGVFEQYIQIDEHLAVSVDCVRFANPSRKCGAIVCDGECSFARQRQQSKKRRDSSRTEERSGAQTERAAVRSECQLLLIAGCEWVRHAAGCRQVNSLGHLFEVQFAHERRRNRNSQKGADSARS
jgi:hypothetical protein